MIASVKVVSVRTGELLFGHLKLATEAGRAPRLLHHLAGEALGGHDEARRIYGDARIHRVAAAYRISLYLLRIKSFLNPSGCFEDLRGSGRLAHVLSQ